LPAIIASVACRISAVAVNVKLEGLVSPNGHVVHVARLDMAAYIDVNYVRMTGFEVRYFGTTIAASGLSLRGAQHCELIGNSIHSIGGKGIYLRVLASDNLVEWNVCRDPRISTWPWSATKAHEEELQGISNRGGRGNVIRFNTVRGTFDGIDSGGDTSSEGIAADTDLDDNRVIYVADDGSETNRSPASTTAATGTGREPAELHVHRAEPRGARVRPVQYVPQLPQGRLQVLDQHGRRDDDRAQHDLESGRRHRPRVSDRAVVEQALQEQHHGRQRAAVRRRRRGREPDRERLRR
jgi:hypothetical protein